MCFPRLYQRRVLCYDLPESIDSRQCPILKKSLRFVLNEFLVISLVDMTFEETALCVSRTLIGLRFGHYEIVARSLEERVPQEFFKTVSYTRLSLHTFKSTSNFREIYGVRTPNRLLIRQSHSPGS